MRHPENILAGAALQQGIVMLDPDQFIVSAAENENAGRLHNALAAHPSHRRRSDGRKSGFLDLDMKVVSRLAVMISRKRRER